tara:strand:- start:514 stop:729 length:216 start_codon:yes stop_codon:yes gene_type:complete
MNKKWRFMLKKYEEPKVYGPGYIKMLQKEVIKDVTKLFNDTWHLLELGSSQADLVESKVIKSINDTFKELR